MKQQQDALDFGTAINSPVVIIVSTAKKSTGRSNWSDNYSYKDVFMYIHRQDVFDWLVKGIYNYLDDL